MSRETTAQEPSLSFRQSSPLNWSQGYLQCLPGLPIWIVDCMLKMFFTMSFLWFQLDKQQFEETIQTLNNLYAEAEKLGGKSYLEGCLACLTAYTIFLCMETHYEKVLKKIGRYIKDQNEKIYAPRGLLLTDPIERGLRVVEITIFEDRSIGSGR
uniref:Golgin subfamily A member 7 n=1 Tax=Labrus bergylta TaxID=56723 RepID=A0A3Q3FLS0_9LABR